MPDYAEVAGTCSSFKTNAASPLYDSCGAYATTNLVKNANMFSTNFHNSSTKSPAHSYAKSASTNVSSSLYNNCADDGNSDSDQQHKFYDTSTSANFMPSVVMYSNRMQQMHSSQQQQKHLQQQKTHMHTTKSATSSPRMNIVENKLDAINNLNRSMSSVQQQHHHQQAIGTLNRGQHHRLPKNGYSDKFSFSELAGRSMEHPLYVKSGEDGNWTTTSTSVMHNASAAYQQQYQQSAVGVLGAETDLPGSGIIGGGGVGGADSITDCSSTTQLTGGHSSGKGSVGHFGKTSPIYLSSFGRTDNA